MKKSTHSKIRNTGILFELLTRQVAADTLQGSDKSPALLIIKEYFKPNTTLAKELLLYQTLLKEKYNSSEKANYLINTTIKLHNKLKKESLKQEKYNLIREIKKHYDVIDFFKTNLNEYKVYASIYRVFEGTTISRLSEVVQSRFTLVEHLTRKKTQNSNQAVSEIVESYLKQDKEIRILAYKLMIDKFNERYAGLSTKQKSLLKEYINNVSNTEDLKKILVAESEGIQRQIEKFKLKIKDKVTLIKLNEVTTMLDRFKKIKTIKEDHILSLLLYHELLKELKNVK